MMDVGDVPIYLRPGYTDGRKAIDGLVGIIQEQMKMEYSRAVSRFPKTFLTMSHKDNKDTNSVF
jgi:hypothetical protein